MGTPEYMAPELSEGPATTSSDIYALGILLYQMVTGRVPFSGDTPIAAYWKQIQELPVPPSRLVPSLPRSLEQVMLRALEKNPRTRYQRAEDLADAYIYALRHPHFSHESLQPSPTVAYRTPVHDEAEVLLPYDSPDLEEDATFVPSPRGHAMQEERLVLPGDPLEAPSAIPTKRNRAGVRNRLTSTFKRPRRTQIAPAPLPPLEPLRHVPLPQAGDHADHSYVPVDTHAEPRPATARRTRHRRRRRYTNPVVVAAFVGLGLLILVSALISLSFLYYSGSGLPAKYATATAQVNATNTANANASKAATATAFAQQAQATAITSSRPLLSDPLNSNTNGRWPEASSTCAFSGGSYHVIVNNTNYLQPCTSNSLSYGNAALQVDVLLLSGHDAGIIFRVNGEQFYDFEITAQGEFFFRRHDTGGGSNYTMLIPATASSAVAPAGQKNTLLVIANGSDFKLYINGNFVGETRDSSYASGQIGLVVGTLLQPTLGEASFANLNVYKA